MVVLLGNPSAAYARTRHNVAWRLLGVGPFCEDTGWQEKFNARWRWMTIGDTRVVLLLPQTMMNRSGESVQAASRFFRHTADQIAVVHDDVELAFGRYALRFGGGLAGHNGLRSVATSLSTREFWRVRIGIGRPDRGDLHGHVLGRFSVQEEAELPTLLAAVGSLVAQAFSRGWRSV